jgi:hypothetical protein
MVYDCLKLSAQYTLDYIEVSSSERTIPLSYDFYFFNYHPSTMAWADTRKLRKLPGLKITMVLEVLPNDPFVMCPENHFDGYCVLDPSLRLKNPKVFAFPRPLEPTPELKPYVESSVPVIGSFGFATKGKGFHHVVEAVNQEFSEAIIRINIPFGSFVPNSEEYSQHLAKLCQEKANPGIQVEVTHHYMSKQELIEWCSQNTLNCFLYDRNMPGLAATTDQAIVSGRPLSVSKNDTFRHIICYLPPYPTWSLKDSLTKSISIVKQMQSDWSPVNFATRFEQMLDQLFTGKSITQQEGVFEIPILRKTIFLIVNNRYKKYKRLFALRKIIKLLSFKDKRSHEELI